MFNETWKEKMKKFNKTSCENRIVKCSNVIQFDEMGYPLRLVIDSQGNQMWVDTTEREDDVVLKWNK